MTDSEDTTQSLIDPFRELNRYDDRHAEYPSTAVYERPRRTLANGWKKWHAARDCGHESVRFVEHTNWRPMGEEYEYRLYCSRCGYRIPEHEVLFVGGEWYNRDAWLVSGKMLEDLWLPPERVLDLGPDPDEDDLREAFRLTRIERENAGTILGWGFNDSAWRPCEDCEQDVLLLFDGRCRMCYDGPWTDRMQETVNALERKIRESNRSFVHRLEQQVDPLSPGGVAGEGEILWRRHACEPTTKLVEVTERFESLDDGHREYELADPTRTYFWRYREEDLANCFWSTGLYSDEPKARMDDEIRPVWQRVCDHSFSGVHTKDGDPAGLQCIDCFVKREGPHEP